MFFTLFGRSVQRCQCVCKKMAAVVESYIRTYTGVSVLNALNENKHKHVDYWINGFLAFVYEHTWANVKFP
jgi:hypothetical protein